MISVHRTLNRLNVHNILQVHTQVSNGTDRGDRWGITRTQANGQICFKIEVLHGINAGRVLVVQNNIQKSNGDVRALVHDTSHREVDQCWNLQKVIMDNGEIGYTIMKSHDRHKDKYLISGVVRDEHTFWISVTDRSIANTLWRIDAVIPIKNGQRINHNNMTATQNSVLPEGGAASRAIDGNKDGQKGSCTHTATNQDSWWNVDIGGNYRIYKVVIFNRRDCCKERIDGSTVRAFQGENQVEFCGTVDYKYKHRVYKIECNGREVANQIRIDQPKNYLSLCEVEIFGERKITEEKIESKLKAFKPPRNKDLEKTMEKDVGEERRPLINVSDFNVSNANTEEKRDGNNTGNRGADGNETDSKANSAESMYLGNIISLLVATTSMI